MFTQAVLPLLDPVVYEWFRGRSLLDTAVQRLTELRVDGLLVLRNVQIPDNDIKIDFPGHVSYSEIGEGEFAVSFLSAIRKCTQLHPTRNDCVFFLHDPCFTFVPTEKLFNLLLPFQEDEPLASFTYTCRKVFTISDSKDPRLDHALEFVPAALACRGVNTLRYLVGDHTLGCGRPAHLLLDAGEDISISSSPAFDSFRDALESV